MSFGADHMGVPKKASEKKTEKPLPVLIGQNYEHVMAQATIEQKAEVRSPTTNKVLEQAEVVITIIAKGPSAQELGDYVAAHDVVALSFGTVPVRPVRKEQ
jgi:hypothetical protein